MTLRLLLPLLTYPDLTPEDSLLRVLDLAATLEAQTTALIHQARIPPVTEPFADLVIDVDAMILAAERLSRDRGEELARLVRHQAERIALPITVETFEADRLCGEAIAERARTFDLTLLPAMPESPDHALVQQEILFRSGGPLLLVPAGEHPAHLGCAAIAWDGSRAAARATRDALPLLAKAGRVVVLTAAADKHIPAAGVADLLVLLEAHGIVAEHLEVKASSGSIGEDLQQAALRADAGLLVMGGFGHSRMREFILGGATSSVLGTPRIAVLMSH